MSTLSLRVPEEKALVQHDAEVGFLARAAMGSPAKGLAVFGKLDQHFRT